jgi:DNA repair exonuclease SbcCD ATPase subunit
MKYIKKVRLINFQSHKDTTIEFDKYLNVIVGPSDQGKSAIIRAIKWVLYNEPSGTFFIREGEKECTVSITFNDNTILKRIRSQSKNLYILIDEKGNESIYEGFGKTVPIDIIEKTNIRKLYLDDNESNTINIGEQLEGPFLLSEKASTRANAIGRLVGVHIIDKAVANTLKDIRSLNSDRKSIENRLSSLKEKLTQYEYLNDLKITLDRLEKIHKTIKFNKEKLKILNNLKEKLGLIELDIKQTEIIINKLSKIYEIEKIALLLENKISKYKKLESKMNQYNNISEEINEYKKLVERLKDINRVKDIVKNINKKVELAKELGKLLNSFSLNSIERNKNINCLNKLKYVSESEVILNNIMQKHNRLDKLINIRNKVIDIEKRLLVGHSYMERLRQIETLDRVVKDIDKKLQLINNLLDYKCKYQDLNNEEVKVESEMKNINKELEEYLNKYKKLLSQIEICPLCLNKIDREDIKKIVNQYR